MQGFSITVLLLPNHEDDDSPSTDFILSLLDDQSDVPGWKWNSRSPPIRDFGSHIDNRSKVLNKTPPNAVTFANHEDICRRVKKAAQALINAEPDITEMDSIAGDGDCGLTLKVRPWLVLCHNSNIQTGWRRGYSPERLYDIKPG